MSTGELQGVRVAVVNWRDVDHSRAGGAERYAWEFARALAEGGAAVEFLTAREPGQARSLEREGIAVHRAGGTLGFYLVTLWRLLVRRRRLDLVIDPAGGLPAFAPLVVRRRTPVVLVVHHVHQAQFGAHFPRPVAELGRWLERVAMRVVYRRRRVLAVSESTAHEMRQQLGWTGEIGILANGSDLPDPIATTPTEPGADRLVVLGRLVSHKRVDLAIRSFFDLVVRPATAARDLRLEVIGQGPERHRLERLVAELGLVDRVTFHGFVDDATKSRLLTEASLHLCASDAEGWGQSVLDAAAHGVPTLARDVPGLRDSVRHARTGWLVPEPPSGDLNDVRRRFSDALAVAHASAADPSTRATMAGDCRTWAARFTWSAMRAQARVIAVEELSGHLVPTVTVPREPRVAI